MAFYFFLFYKPSICYFIYHSMNVIELVFKLFFLTGDFACLARGCWKNLMINTVKNQTSLYAYDLDHSKDWFGKGIGTLFEKCMPLFYLYIQMSHNHPLPKNIVMLLRCYDILPCCINILHVFPSINICIFMCKNTVLYIIELLMIHF